MDYIVEMLNRKPQGGVSPYAEALIRLMEELQGHGGNLRKMMDGDPKLAATVAEVCVTRWIPSTNRTAHLVLQPSWAHILKRGLTPGQVDRMRPERLAAMLFHVGTLNPEWHKLAGPCARCGRYYLKKRASQKVYCSRRCGNAATAIARTREKLRQEREDKIKRVKGALRTWRAVRGKEDWKAFVSRKTGINKRFLTRHETELKPPTKDPKTGERRKRS